MMFQRLYKSSFYLMALSFLFLSVACSHTQRKVAKLDELEQFDELTATELKEEAKQDAKKSAPEKANSAEAPSESPVSQNDFSVPADGALANPEAQLRVASDFTSPTPEEAPQPPAEPQKEEAVANAPTEEVLKNDLEQIKEEPVKVEAPVASNAVAPQAPKVEAAAPAAAEVAKVAEASPAAAVASNAVEARTVEAKDSGAPSQEALAADAQDAEENKEVEMASANVSSLIEKNLLWIAFAIVGGVIVTFLNIRRNRRSGTHT